MRSEVYERGSAAKPPQSNANQRRPDMSEPNAWIDQVTVALEDRAYSLNYNEGVQCRYRKLPMEGAIHTIEIFLETTHAGHPFDLTWLTRFSEDPGAGIDFDLSAPANEGGLLWRAHHDTVEAFRLDAHAMPVFVRGFFIGRAVAARVAEEAKGA